MSAPVSLKRCQSGCRMTVSIRPASAPSSARSPGTRSAATCAAVNIQSGAISVPEPRKRLAGPAEYRLTAAGKRLANPTNCCVWRSCRMMMASAAVEMQLLARASSRAAVDAMDRFMLENAVLPAPYREGGRSDHSRARDGGQHQLRLVSILLSTMPISTSSTELLQNQSTMRFTARAAMRGRDS
jgi:hypothetical protein